MGISANPANTCLGLIVNFVMRLIPLVTKEPFQNYRNGLRYRGV